MSHAPQPGRRAALALAPGLALAACTAPQVEQTAGYSGGRLPRPERIYVVDPGVAADDVKLDDGVRQRLAQMTSDQSLSQQRLAAGRQAAGGVAAEVQVYYRDGQAAPRLISSFEATAQSPMTPGALGTMGAGAVVGRVAEVAASNAILSNVSNARSADTGSEGRRIGDALGLRLGRIFAEQGWIPESAVH